MRGIRFALVLGLFVGAPALADEFEIDQNASANFTFVTVVHPASSNIRINQAGDTNAISSFQLAPDSNLITTTQSGSFNTVVLHQQGFIDAAVVIQSGPGASPHETDVPTTYNMQEIDEGFLGTFTSGEVSMITLTSPETTYVSHFGRRH